MNEVEFSTEVDRLSNLFDTDAIRAEYVSIWKDIGSNRLDDRMTDLAGFYIAVRRTNGNIFARRFAGAGHGISSSMFGECQSRS